MGEQQEDTFEMTISIPLEFPNQPYHLPPTICTPYSPFGLFLFRLDTVLSAILQNHSFSLQFLINLIQKRRQFPLQQLFDAHYPQKVSLMSHLINQEKWIAEEDRLLAHHYLQRELLALESAFLLDEGQLANLICMRSGVVELP